MQEILGHAEMSTTAIYTRVSIKHLVRIHEQTHPASKLDGGKVAHATGEVESSAEALMEALEAEGDDDVAAADDG